MDLGTLANIGTMLAVLIALVFGVAQYRQNAAKRRDQAASEIISAALSPEFMAALDLVLALPDHASPETIQNGGSHMLGAMRQLDFTYEVIGWMVYRRVIALDAVDEMMGGIARLAWRKLDVHFKSERERADWQNAGEWFQWLVDQLEAHPLAWKASGAHVAKRAWKP